MKRIVLLGPWCWTFLTFARCCRRQGIEPYLLEVGGKPGAWQRYSSCLAGGSTIDVEMIGTPDGIERVHDYTASVRAQALVSVANARMLWLARHRNVFEPGCKLLMPPADVLHRAGSKLEQIDLAKQVGFDVLPTVCLTGHADLAKVPTDSYPVVLRPERRHRGPPPFKVKVAHSRSELEKIVADWGIVCAPLIAQPLLPLPNLVVHGVRSEKGEILTLIPFLVPRKFEAVSLTIMPASFPPEVEKCCREFVTRADITGCFHFELLFSSRRQRVWFLEINARLGGTTDKVTALGFDESLYLLRSYGLVPPAETSPSLNQRLAANKRALLKHALKAVAGRLDEIDYPAGSRMRAVWHSMRDLVLAKDSVFNWRDLRGIFWKIPRVGCPR